MTTAIELSDVIKSFQQVKAVDGISFNIRQGEVVALLGPNGAGKSTTADMILGLQNADSGEISVAGRHPRKACENGLVGAMLQSSGLPTELTVRETVALMARFYPNSAGVDETIQAAGISAIAGKRTDRLSGGESQRARFALALIADPKILVLDEPTAAMDVASRHEFWNTMRSAAERGRTLVFATHYLEEADKYADRIILMRQGRVVADGTSASIKSAASSRTVSFEIAGEPGLNLDTLAGVTSVARTANTYRLTCDDSDSVLRRIISAFPGAFNFEVSATGLDEAFLALTKGDTGDD